MQFVNVTRDGTVVLIELSKFKQIFIYIVKYINMS
jgi:hypothetical protein